MYPYKYKMMNALANANIKKSIDSASILRCKEANLKTKTKKKIQTTTFMNDNKK